MGLEPQKECGAGQRTDKVKLPHRRASPPPRARNAGRVSAFSPEIRLTLSQAPEETLAVGFWELPEARVTNKVILLLLEERITISRSQLWESPGEL